MPEDKETIELLIDGGKASPGPTTAPKFAALKINMGEVFKSVNEKTKDYSGMQVPVKVIIDRNTKEYEIKIGTPPVSSLIKKELGIGVAKITEEDKTKGKVSVGSLGFEKVVNVAKAKMEDFLSNDLKNAVKQVLGTCVSMKVFVNEKPAKEISKEIDEGKFDNFFAN